MTSYLTAKSGDGHFWIPRDERSRRCEPCSWWRQRSVRLLWRCSARTWIMAVRASRGRKRLGFSAPRILDVRGASSAVARRHVWSAHVGPSGCSRVAGVARERMDAIPRCIQIASMEIPLLPALRAHARVAQRGPLALACRRAQHHFAGRRPATAWPKGSADIGGDDRDSKVEFDLGIFHLGWMSRICIMASMMPLGIVTIGSAPGSKQDHEEFPQSMTAGE